MKQDPECPFCNPGVADRILSNEWGYARWDGFPVSPGHVLVIPHQHAPDWWAVDERTRMGLSALVDEVRELLEARLPRPDGYNVGFNAGAAAGQTVGHLHIHVIPRYRGDVANPTGGVRGVIPGRADYRAEPIASRTGTAQAPSRRALRSGPHHPLLPAFADAITSGEVTRADLVIAFVLDSGVALLMPHLEAILDSGGSVRVLTSDYLNGTQRAALERLWHRQQEYGDRFSVRVFFTKGGSSFHPKAYLLGDGPSGYRVGFLGSANASVSGLLTGVEWSLESRDPAALAEAHAAFQVLWDDRRSVDLSRSVIEGWVDRPTGGGPYSPASIEAAGREPAEVNEPVLEPVAPTAVQEQALAALEFTRADGFGAGLVVLATGLGKTWLAAFDASRPQFRRVLFVAHREEILTQAREVFRCIRGEHSVGMLIGERNELNATIVMASIQTLANRLDQVDPRAFDYVVIDEFHHAAATSYRRVVNHLQPQFLLGLTATPDRADGSDILSLCEDNLVFECGPAEGIERGLLSPFAYHGVPDPVDFRPLPWRSSRFDPTALEQAVISDDRATAAFREWDARRGTRSLGFCVSQRHADHMAAQFRARGVQAVAVHTGPTSAPRHESLTDLESGELDIVFAVDIFNEGVDVPAIDTVLMLRPTASMVLFLQQIGRGLRLSEGKERLVVVDFVGNHRAFLLPLRILAGLSAQREAGVQEIRRVLEGGQINLPPGCSVDYSLESRQTLMGLLPRARGGALRSLVQEWVDIHGSRPTAGIVYRMGGNPSAAPGKWFAFLADEGWLSDDELRVAREHDDLLVDVATTSMTKSYKMVALRAFAEPESLTHGQSVSDLAEVSRRLVLRDPRLVADTVGKEMADPVAVSGERWEAWWRKWPLEHLAGKAFRLEGEVFRVGRRVAPGDSGLLAQLIGELIDWRLAAYHDRESGSSALEAATVRVVRNSSGKPILMLDRATNSDLPSGRDVQVLLDGTRYGLDFMKVAVNVARHEGSAGNALPDILWTWFGPRAGEPGTDFRVRLWQEPDGWHAEPVPRGGAVQSLKA